MDAVKGRGFCSRSWRGASEVQLPPFTFCRSLPGWTTECSRGAWKAAATEHSHRADPLQCLFQSKVEITVRLWLNEGSSSCDCTERSFGWRRATQKRIYMDLCSPFDLAMRGLSNLCRPSEAFQSHHWCFCRTPLLWGWNGQAADRQPEPGSQFTKVLFHVTAEKHGKASPEVGLAFKI